MNKLQYRKNYIINYFVLHFGQSALLSYFLSFLSYIKNSGLSKDKKIILIAQ